MRVTLGGFPGFVRSVGLRTSTVGSGFIVAGAGGFGFSGVAGVRFFAGARSGQERTRQHRQRQRIAGMFALMASSNNATSSTLRAIGPWTPRLRSIAAASVCATRPMLGRIADDAAEARRITQATAHVGAGARAMPCRWPAPRQHHPRNRRRSARCPRVSRRAEHFVERVGAGAELRRVGFGVDHPAMFSRCSTRMSDFAGIIILVDRRALGGQHAGGPRSGP